MSEDDKPKVDVNVVQVLGSALAAVSSAVLLSTVGVAGTLIGAAVGSVIATVGGAVYAYSLDVSKRRVASAAQLAAATRLRRSGAPTQRLATQELPVVQAPDEEPGRVESPDEGWREALSNLNWKRVGLVTLGVFLAAMAVIIAFEVVAGRPVSTFTGGTDSNRSGTTLGGSSEPTSSPTPTPTPSPTPSSTAPSESAVPSETPGESPSVAPGEPATPTVTPSPDPTATEVPSPSTSVSVSPAG